MMNPNRNDMKQITEEQINEAARLKFYSGAPALELVIAQIGFEHGAKWMQSQQSEWISVKDRLPETIRLLAFTGGLTITLTYIDGIYYSGDGHIWCSEVTHWMPLPTSPQ